MKNDFKILFKFLEQTGPEVTGRESAEPEVHVAELLERFARGECDSEERADVCQILRRNPPWMHWLASHVVLARNTQRPEPEAAAS